MKLVIRFLEEYAGEEAFTLESRLLSSAHLKDHYTSCHKPRVPQ